MLLITNATICTPDRRIANGAVLADGGRIRRVGSTADLLAGGVPDGAVRVDAGGDYLVPGFIDLQFNGGFGRDFTVDPSSIWDVATGLARYGVTAFLPTVITSPLATVEAARRIVTSGRPAGFAGATPLGLHVEGPFLNPRKKGAHNPAHIQAATLGAVEDWSPERGVSLVTLAPEMPGALEVVAALTARGVLVSAGHTMATYDEARAGFDAGIRYGTHLFNAMPALHHRDPGLPGALLTDSRVTAGVIPDGVHTHPAIVALVWQALGPTRMSVVTDAMAALGMPPGHHRLGDFDVHVDATSARLADGTLAGSILSLDEALRNVIRFTGCRLEDALQTMTATPARVLGLGHQRGHLEAGYAADLVLLSGDLQVRQTFVGGVGVYRRETASR